jgi:chemotaxis protein CheD
MKAAPDALEIFLQPGEFYFGENKTRIRTLLGSCVAVTLWHPRLHVGGMCHYLLPQRPRPKPGDALDGRYAEDAMQMFMHELRRSRTKPKDYQVKLFGGGSMFEPSIKARTHVSISQKNIEFGRALMSQYGFNIQGEDMGGKGHRNVILDLWSGDIWVKRAARITFQ